MTTSVSAFSVTTTQSLPEGYGLFLIDAIGGNLTLTLPDIVADGLNFFLKRLDSSATTNTVTLQGFNGGQTIDGVATFNMINEQATRVVAHNSVWFTGQSKIPTSENYVSAFDSTTQPISVANTFQTFTFNTTSMSNWTYGAGTFTCNQTGLYLITYNARSNISLLTGTASALIAKNGTEISGSQSGFGISTVIPGQLSGNFVQRLVSGDTIVMKVTGTTTTISIAPQGSGATTISGSLTIVRLA